MYLYVCFYDVLTYFIPYSLFMYLDTIEGLTFMCPILPLVTTYGK